MMPLVVSLVLLAAVLHASWNAMLRASDDRLWTLTVMSFASTVVSIPVAILMPLPPGDGWAFIIGSSLLQVAYSVFLSFAYRVGELGQVYPVVRGSVPVLVTLTGFAFAGQHLDTPRLVGVGLISGGVAALALGRGRAPPRSLMFAFVTAVFVCAYVTVDGIGVRVVGNPWAYAAWICLVFGALMPLAYRAIGGPFPATLRSRATLAALGGGVVSLISYTAVIWALSMGKLGPVAALRETSVVFSVLIGRLLLREPLGWKRLVACAAVATGAVVIGAVR